MSVRVKICPRCRNILPKAINLELVEPEFTVTSDTVADVVFDEWQGASNNRKRAFKQLKLRRAEDQWLVEQELVLFSY